LDVVKLVLDASAILSGVTIPCTDDMLMPPLVEAELGHAWARRKLESLKGIDAVFHWKYRCKGCRKIFDTAIKECPVCGAQVRSYRGKGAGGRVTDDDGRRDRSA
jgi:rRNA maturation endonuclease Nob1